jgi:hypothetical protein
MLMELLRISYIISLPEFDMRNNSFLMGRIKEHQNLAGCDDCTRFIEYYEGTKQYRILPSVPSCAQAILIVKQYYYHRGVQMGIRYPREGKYASGAHRISDRSIHA